MHHFGFRGRRDGCRATLRENFLCWYRWSLFQDKGHCVYCSWLQKLFAHHLFLKFWNLKFCLVIILKFWNVEMVRLHRSGFRGRPDGCRVILRSIPWSWIFRRSIFPRKLLTSLIPTSRIFDFAHLLTFPLLSYDQNGIRFARPGGFFFRSATRTKGTSFAGRPSGTPPGWIQNGPTGSSRHC